MEYAKSAKGYIAFIKTDSDKEVLRSQVDKGMRNMTSRDEKSFLYYALIELLQNNFQDYCH